MGMTAFDWEQFKAACATEANARSVLDVMRQNGATAIIVTGGEAIGIRDAARIGYATALDHPDAVSLVRRTIRDDGATYPWVRIAARVHDPVAAYDVRVNPGWVEPEQLRR